MDEITNVENMTTTQSPAIKMGWLRVLLFFIIVVISMSVGNLIGLSIGSIFFDFNLESALQDPANILNELGIRLSLLVTISGFLGTLLAIWIFRKFIDRKSLISLGLYFNDYKTDLYQGLVWGLGMVSAGFCILYIVNIISIVEINFNFGSLLGYFILFFFVSLNEEIMIRGYILNNLSQSMNKYIALIFSSVLFSAMHLGNANMSLIPFINIVLAGILLGIYYIHKQNLWFPIGMHLTWNYFQGPVLGFEVSGTKTYTLITQNIEGNTLITGGEFGFEGSLLATFIMIIAITVIHFQFRKTDLSKSGYL